jgi:hypothetical protein
MKTTTPAASTSDTTKNTSSTSTTSTTSTSKPNGALLSPTSLHTTPHQGFSSGAVAGIAIATAVAGAIFTIIGICIFLKRRRASTYSSRRSGGLREVTQRTVAHHRPVLVGLNEIPLSRVDDSKIRRDMQDLNVLIHQHVENHYHTRKVKGINPDLTQELVQIGYPDSPETLAALLNSPRTRRTAIRRLISSVIFSNIDIENNKDMSLLPGYIADFTRAIFRIERKAEDQGKRISLLDSLSNC